MSTQKPVSTQRSDSIKKSEQHPYSKSFSKTAKTQKKKKSAPNNESPLRQFNKTFCHPRMTTNECESAILRHYVDKNEAIAKVTEVQEKDVKRMTKLLEDYLRKARLVCYGGTAINNILPPAAQFYDHDLDTPDYDFYSPTPIDSAKEVADMYFKAGFTEVEAKSGTHRGTMKVFVNFIGIADITLLDPLLFETVQKDAIAVDGILYAPPDFLRMNAYIEMSRPLGDVSRWEKVNKRLNLLNQFYPMKRANTSKVQTIKQEKQTIKEETVEDALNIVRDVCIKEGAVFFGGYAASFYARYMPPSVKQAIYNEEPDFDAIHVDPEKVVKQIKAQLKKQGITNITIRTNPPVGEVLPVSYTVLQKGQSITSIYGTTACYNFNRIQIGRHTVRVATTDTALYFLLALFYTRNDALEKARILSLAHKIWTLQIKTKLLQKDILKRFNSSCEGNQMTLGDIKSEKSRIFQKYKGKEKDAEYELHMFKYIPT